MTKSAISLVGPKGLLRRTVVYSRLGRGTRASLKIASELLSGPSPSRADILKAAGILRSLDYSDQAIAILIERQYYKEAADILVTMNRTDEAGSLYVRAKVWSSAFQCFETAAKPLKAAKCALRLGDFVAAAHLFEKAGAHLLAAKCRVRNGEWRGAAALFIKANKHSLAYEALCEWARRDLESNADLTPMETIVLIKGLSQNNLVPEVIAKLDAIGKASDLGKALVQRDRLEETVILTSTRPAVLKELCEWALSEAKLTDKLIHVCQKIGDHERIAVLYESSRRPTAAIDAWVKAGNSEAALRCAIAAQDFGRAQSIRAKLSDAQTAKPRYESKANASLSLSTVTEPAPMDFVSSQFLRSFDEADRTALWRSGEIKVFGQGETLLNLDDFTAGTITVINGNVDILRLDPKGDLSLVRTCGPGDTIGEAWCSLNLRSCVRLVARTEGSFHLAHRDRLIALSPALPGLRTRLLGRVLEHLKVRMNQQGSHDSVYALAKA